MCVQGQTVVTYDNVVVLHVFYISIRFYYFLLMLMPRSSKHLYHV